MEENLLSCGLKAPHPPNSYSFPTIIFEIQKNGGLHQNVLWNREGKKKKIVCHSEQCYIPIVSLALVCILRRVFEQLVNSRAVTMLRYTRCNVVILMAAAAWLMSFNSCIVCGFDSYTVFFKCPQRKFLSGHLKSTVYETNPHTVQELKDISNAVAAVKITTLHRVYLSMFRRAHLCIDVVGNHLQHLLWWYILSAFGYCINFCIYAMLRIRATFSWSILYETHHYTF